MDELDREAMREALLRASDELYDARKFGELEGRKMRAKMSVALALVEHVVFMLRPRTRMMLALPPAPGGGSDAE